MEHRWLYYQDGEVPEEPYIIPLGVGNVLREGKDITIVATSWMNVEALHAAEILEKRGISVEIIDPRTIVPLDEEIIVKSVKKTKNCVVADNDWTFCGFGAEIASRISKECFGVLESPVERIGFAPTPCPTGRVLENEFYPNAEKIVRAIEEKLKLEPADLSGENFYSHEHKFKGPF